MIYGIGTDLVEIERIKKACIKETFLIRCFTPREIELFGGNMVRAAGNFAVKEAVSKALGTGFRSFGPLDIEVLRDELGKPWITLYNGAFRLAQEMGIKKWHVSITNTKELAQAFVVGEDEP